MAEPGGLLLVDKPAGVSSFGALARLRRRYGRKIGHAGTLDPFATGLLLALVGRATRLAPYLVGADKGYDATVAFGVRSTTDDPEGDLEPTGATTDEAAVRAALPGFVGVIEQVPPAASAVHVDGERAYRRFRRGEAVTVPARRVIVHRLELMRFDPTTQTAALRVDCGSGTYVRSLARDLGDALGTGAYLTALRRTRVGRFDVADAAAPDAILDAAVDPLRPLIDCVPELPRRSLDAEETRRARHGMLLAGAADGPIALLGDDGRLIAIGRPADGGVRPATVLEPA